MGTGATSGIFLTPNSEDQAAVPGGAQFPDGPTASWGGFIHYLSYVLT